MENFNFKINYDECLTNVACSILKYFDCTYYHKTLDILDKILSEKKPKNVVLILFDGLGSRLLDKILDKDSFLLKHRIAEITSVFPSTTTASTFSVQTGLNPCEHGWLGWSNYIKPIDTIIQLFWDVEKGKNSKDEKNEEFIKIKKEYLSPKNLVDKIKEKGDEAFTLSPYLENAVKYTDLNNMFEKIKEKLEIKNGKKKFLYVYNSEPDSSMHRWGADSEQAKQKILERNNKMKEFYEKNQDKETMFIIVADHGHLNSDYIKIKDYPDIEAYLDKDIYIESRCPMFKIVPGKEEIFKNTFEAYFGDYFYLLSKEEILQKQIFGDVKYKENELFQSSLGDFMAINKGNNNNAFLGFNDFPLASIHGGYADVEVYIPLIVLTK